MIHDGQKKSLRTRLRPTTTKTEATSGYKPAGGTIRTRWAAHIDPKNVLPEYPRPQMVRSDWCNLNGLWDYAIVDKSQPMPSQFQGKILVPFAAESALSGVGKAVGEKKRLWYRRTFTIPEAWNNTTILLHFGGVDWDCNVRVNGTLVGSNSGQSCNAPTRMLVPASGMNEVIEIARAAVAKVKVGAPDAEGTPMGPVVSRMQFDKIQLLIQAGIDEGATLVCGGPGKPEGLETGYYVKPTVFANVRNDMTIAREEIFGPVLSILKWSTEDEAIAIANSTEYGLASGVWTQDLKRAMTMARRLQSGFVWVNTTARHFVGTPFGGWKNSGLGLEECLQELLSYTHNKAVHVFV